MNLPPTEVLFVNGLIAGVVVLGVLRILAARLGNACELHDLKTDCDRLRRDYAERLAALRQELDGEVIEVDVVGQVGQEEAAKLAA